MKSVGRATRNGGAKSATAAAAYRSGGVVLKAAAYRSAQVMTDRATGEVFDYTRKQGVLEAHILTPENVASPAWAQDRNRLWNAAERAEPRKNGRIATEIEVALPHTLSREQNRALVLGYAQGIADRYGVVADVAIHQGHDARNIHSHILFSHREITEHGFGALSNRHMAEKGGREVQVAGIAAQPRDVEALRVEWGRHVNAAYERAGQELRADHRSYQRQGRDLTPTRYLGPRQSDPERARLREERAACNERIMARRQERERQALDRAHREREQQHRREQAQVPIAAAPALTASGGRERGLAEAEDENAKLAAEIDAWRNGLEREWQGRGSPIKPAEPDLAWEALRERLEAEAWSDRKPGSRETLTAEDIAHDLSPEYRAATHEMQGEKSARATAEAQIKNAAKDKEIAAYRAAERLDAMSGWARLLHKTGFSPDTDLAHWQNRVKAAERIEERGHTHKTTAAAALTVWERWAAAAFAAVKPAAERDLAQRQERAENARVELAQRGAWITDPAPVTDPVERQRLGAWQAFHLGEMRWAEQQAEKEQRQAQAQKARLAAEQRERPEQAPRQKQAQSQRPEERQEQRAQKPRQGQAMNQEERAEAYWQRLVARGRARKDEREDLRQDQTQRQTLRHGPRMGM